MLNKLHCFGKIIEQNPGMMRSVSFWKKEFRKETVLIIHYPVNLSGTGINGFDIFHRIIISFDRGPVDQGKRVEIRNL